MESCHNAADLLFPVIALLICVFLSSWTEPQAQWRIWGNETGLSSWTEWRIRANILFGHWKFFNKIWETVTKMQLLTHFRAAFGSPFSIQRIRFLWARMCFGTNYSTTEYEHDISLFYWKSTYYKQGLFVDSTPEYGVRTMGFHILLYINIIPKQHVRSPVTLNVTSGVVSKPPIKCIL